MYKKVKIQIIHEGLNICKKQFYGKNCTILFKYYLVLYYYILNNFK